MKQPLWKPSPDTIRNANVTRFIELVNRRYQKQIQGYFDLHEWSVANIPEFWATVWEFVDIRASKRYDRVADDLSRFPGVQWFPGAELNFAENLLRYRDDAVAITFKSELNPPVSTTFRELHRKVARLADALREQGVKKGDRVVAYMPNMTETAIAMLATTSLGAVWASCGSELGVGSVIDRFSQITPKILFSVDGYGYKNKPFPLLNDVRAVAESVPSIEKTIIAPYISERPDISTISNGEHYADVLSQSKSETITFEQVPFEHPVFIMFSSGTTGKPKCMVQSGGGVLINHLKELVLSADLRREDTIMYMTAPSWMMWNWLLSSLAVGSRVVLFDGNPGYPDLGAMWRLVEEEKITIFGTSATYIHMLKGQDYKPGDFFDLSSLREVCQTGSALSAEGFEYVYENVKNDLHFNSISGGTDINGCFASGCPTLPVYAGQLQGPSLGMKIKAYDDQGNPVYDRQGELVCEAPAPSMPICFWNDHDMTKYRETYFSVYPGVWRHGDFVEISSRTGGITFFGRSDAILKPSGVRIGTAEIYNVVDSFNEVADSVAIGQNWENDQRIILFIKAAFGMAVTDDLKDKIRKTLRDKASPRHVPSLIFEVPDIPYTFNMKKVESAITNIINGRPVTNKDALVNPQSLDYFEQLLPEVQR
jgi:acetoacetyl-CoA synthetase